MVRPRRDIPWRVRCLVGFTAAHRYGVAVFGLLTAPMLTLLIQLGGGPDWLSIGVAFALVVICIGYMAGWWG